MRRVAVVATCGAIVLAAGAVPALASEQHPTVGEVSQMVMCPSCDVTLDRSDSPSADRMRVLVRRRIAAGDTRQEVLDHLVAEYGGDQGILAVPPRHGRGLVAWLVPLGAFIVLLLGAAITLRGWVRRRPGRDHASSSSSSSGS